MSSWVPPVAAPLPIRRSLALAVVAGLMLIGLTTAHAAAAAEQRVGLQPHYRAVCPRVPGQARCMSFVVTDGSGRPIVRERPRAMHASPSTVSSVNCASTINQTCYSPTTLHTAYQLPWTSPVQQTIALIDAFDHPYVKSHLDVFDSSYGLGAFPSCGGSITTACFQRVDENGYASGFTNSNPSAAQHWDVETDMDVQYAHAICTNCKILLVEAYTASSADLATAVNTAARLGATEISNSYSLYESVLGTGTTVYASSYNHPGIAITASTGDNGFGPVSPADFNTVVAVGGTRLNVNTDGSYYSESAWGNGTNGPNGWGTGGGCSTFGNTWAAAPTWQTGVPNWQYTGCGDRRSLADVAADADPNSGVWVYSIANGQTGWVGSGGTSLSAPIIAGVYALAGNAWKYSWPAQIPYLYPNQLHDVTSGSNGSCSYYIQCHGWSGFDGPTGLGTPWGLGGF